MPTRYNTGNPIESTDVRDMSDNAKNFDEFSNSMSDSFTDRFGVDRQTMEGAVRKAGFRPASFDFLTGGSLVSGDRNKAVFNPAPPGDNNWYAWQGAFPKIISPNSTPSTSGGLGDNAWKPVTNNILAPTVMESIRRSYAEAGYNVVGTFLEGFTYVNANNVGIDETTGKGFTGPAGPVAAGTDPTSGGFVDVSGKINPVFQSVSELKATNAVVGCLYLTKGYYAAGDGGGAEYVAVTSGVTPPDGYGDHLAANGVVLQLVSQPTDLNHGVKVSGTFVAADAWNNRNALQSMMRNLRYGYVELAAVGTYYVLGSVNIGRDGLTVNHKVGCKVIGRYNDASIPASFTSQAGGAINFTKYVDPDNGVFHPVTEYTERVNYILDGDFSTEYNAGHAALHNNNCVSFYKVKGCSARGTGGISGSDHRGINFDGGAINCHIDIGYAMGTMDQPLIMKSDAVIGNKCTVRVGRIDSVPFGGSNAPIAVRIEGGYSLEVEIGSFMWDGVTKPQLVGAFNCNSVNVRAGYVNGASQLLRQYETLISDVSVAHVRNTPWGIVRAGVAANAMRSAKLHGIKSIDSAFLYAYLAENNEGTFRLLEISDNDFTGGSAGFKYYNGRTASGLPDVYDLHDNFSPAGFTSSDFNPRTFGISGNLSSGTSFVTVNYKSPDWIYGKLSIVVTSGGGNYGVEIDLRTRELTGTTVGYWVGPTSITTTKSGGSLSISCAAGTFFLVTLHN